VAQKEVKMVVETQKEMDPPGRTTTLRRATPQRKDAQTRHDIPTRTTRKRRTNPHRPIRTIMVGTVRARDILIGAILALTGFILIIGIYSVIVVYKSNTIEGTCTTHVPVTPHTIPYPIAK
jgi:hypothetical protein